MCRRMQMGTGGIGDLLASLPEALEATEVRCTQRISLCTSGRLPTRTSRFDKITARFAEVLYP
jgi:hypothetical protein